MSGIAGMVNPNESILQKCINICAMSDAIRKRGQCGAGHFISSNAALLQRVGQVSHAGHMPTVTKICINGVNYVLAMDGVIYNHRDLRSELNLGTDCSGSSCAETLIYAYEKWKDDFIKKLNGIFAFALWIDKEKTLILARDQLGMRPLFYAFSGRILMFSSEIGGILSNPLYDINMDIEGLSELICLSPRFTPGSSIFKGVHQIVPGYYLKYSQQGVKSVRYWKIENRQHEDSLDKTLETVRELVTGSIRRQAEADAPVCGLLSGGLYSSIITSVVSERKELHKSNVYNTWSVNYEKSSQNIRFASPVGDPDTPWVRWVCRRAGTRHHYIILSSRDIAGALIDAAEARGFPGMPDYDASLLLLCREIRKDYSIVLSGDCSDEVFGANIRAFEHFAAGKKRLPWSSNLAEKISVFNNELISIIKPYEFIEKCYEEALTEYQRFTGSPEKLRKDHEAQWFSLYWNLPCILERLDRIGMAFGLEIRVPFCDVELIEYFWNIPQELKRLNNMERGLLREAMRGLLPPDILERKKNPYPRPHDPEYDTRIRYMLSEIVLDPGSPVKNLLNLKTLESMIKQQPEPNKRYTMRSQLYGWLIQLDHFMRVNGITSL